MSTFDIQSTSRNLSEGLLRSFTKSRLSFLSPGRLQSADRGAGCVDDDGLVTWILSAPETSRRHKRPGLRPRLLRLLFHITAGRGLDHAESIVAQFHRGLDGDARMTLHPGIPVRPPASRLLVGAVEPALRIELEVVVEPMATLLRAGGLITPATCPLRARQLRRPYSGGRSSLCCLPSKRRSNWGINRFQPTNVSA